MIAVVCFAGATLIGFSVAVQFEGMLDLADPEQQGGRWLGNRAD